MQRRRLVGALDLHNHTVAMSLAAVRIVLNTMDFSKCYSTAALAAHLVNSANRAVNAATSSSSSSGSDSNWGSSADNGFGNANSRQFDEWDIDSDNSNSNNTTTNRRSSSSTSRRSSSSGAASRREQPQWPLHVHSCLHDLHIITGIGKNRDGVVPQVQPAVLHMLNTLGLDAQQHTINQGLLIVSSKSLLKYTKARLAAEAAAAAVTTSSRSSDRNSGRHSSRRQHRDSRAPVRGRRQ
jgi:hypothetical protein